MSAVMELSMLPLDKEGTRSHYIAQTLDMIRESGLPHHFAPFSAFVEGEWDELMALADRCFRNLATQSRHLDMHFRVRWRPEEGNRLISGGFPYQPRP